MMFATVLNTYYMWLRHFEFRNRNILAEIRLKLLHHSRKFFIFRTSKNSRIMQLF